MTTFDYQQVRKFADGLNAELDQCENGEGIQCFSLDSTLIFCADRCYEFSKELRQWGRGVFSGQVAFDPDAEQLWKAELLRLYTRAAALLATAKQAEDMCFVLDGQQKLGAALFRLAQFIHPWVTPKLAVAPSARQVLGDDFVDEVKRQIASLPSLPADWMPVEARQAKRFKKLKA